MLPFQTSCPASSDSAPDLPYYSRWRINKALYCPGKGLVWHGGRKYHSVGVEGNVGIADPQPGGQTAAAQGGVRAVRLPEKHGVQSADDDADARRGNADAGRAVRARRAAF